jgi:hypothetical protein
MRCLVYKNGIHMTVIVMTKDDDDDDDEDEDEDENEDEDEQSTGVSVETVEEEDDDKPTAQTKGVPLRNTTTRANRRVRQSHFDSDFVYTNYSSSLTFSQSRITRTIEHIHAMCEENSRVKHTL